MTDALDLDALDALLDGFRQEPSYAYAALRDALIAAAPALIAMARRAQQDAAREGTHAPDCHLWGRRHYDCLLGKYEASRAEVENIIDKLMAMEACTANEDAETLTIAATALDNLLAAVRYADTRAVSRAAYPHACVEDRKLRDLIDIALSKEPSK